MVYEKIAGIITLTVVWLVISALIMKNNYASWITPGEWYDRGYNWFGAIVMWLLYCLAIAPAVIPYGLFQLVKWLFTVGHKD